MTDDPQRLKRWQTLTLGLMFAGYTGYYLCRSNLPVTQPEIIKDLAKSGMTEASARDKIGAMISIGTLAYALGKLVGGSLGDAIGGRRYFLSGMAGAILCTLLFAMGGSLPVFTLAWIGNRFIQSIGFLGMVKITSRWFPYRSYGSAMGFLSLSFLFGDAANRYFLGWLLAHDLGWRTIFVITASVLFGLFLLSLFFLRESPETAGLPEPEANPLNVYGKTTPDSNLQESSSLFLPLIRSPMFWLVCLLSAGLTFVRETFNNWTPTYFREDLGLSKDVAAHYSSLFPLLGGISVLLLGIMSDRLGQIGRAAIICGGIFLAGITLALLGQVDFHGSIAWRVGLIGAVAFLLIGPYSFLAGAIALDVGGKRGSALASGLIDCSGYVFGGAWAGLLMAKVSSRYGWHGAFDLLAVVAWASSLVAGIFLFDQWRAWRRKLVTGEP